MFTALHDVAYLRSSGYRSVQHHLREAPWHASASAVRRRVVRETARFLAMGAAVLAAAPILSCETMAVSASDIDDTALQEAFLLWEDELYNAFSLEGTIDALSWPVNVRDYYGQIAFLVEAIGVGGGEVSPPRGRSRASLASIQMTQGQTVFTHTMR